MQRSAGSANECRQLPDRREFGIIMDVEASRAIRQAEVGAAKTMIERTGERFGVKPERLAADRAYGSAAKLNWPRQREADHAAHSRHRQVQAQGRHLLTEDFTFHKAGDIYTCPAGAVQARRDAVRPPPAHLPARRLRLRGPRGPQDEFTLAAIAQNLRRLAKFVARATCYGVRCCVSVACVSTSASKPPLPSGRTATGTSRPCGRVASITRSVLPTHSSAYSRPHACGAPGPYDMTSPPLAVLCNRTQRMNVGYVSTPVGTDYPMSRGPGPIEQAIAAAFQAEPDRIFTVPDLCRIAYANEASTWPVDRATGDRSPPENRRRSVHRAAMNVARRLGWKHWVSEVYGRNAKFERGAAYHQPMARNANTAGSTYVMPGSQPPEPTRRMLALQAAQEAVERKQREIANEYIAHFQALRARYEELTTELEEVKAGMEMLVVKSRLLAGPGPAARAQRGRY
jgi:hypothetical protein